MPKQGQAIHVDKLLSNVSVKYKNEAYIADMVFPAVPVKKTSDLYRIYTRNFRIPETARANKAEARESDFDVTNSSYVLEKHALKGYVSDDDRDNFDVADLRADMTEDLTDKILRRKEKLVADLFTTTNWSLNVSLSAAQQFNGTTTADPIAIFDTASTTVIQNSGFMPNFGILPRTGFVNAKNNAQVLDRIKYTSREVTQAMLASLFGLQELLVPNSSYDTSALGVASSISAIWDDNAFVGYKPSRPSPMAPSSGYHFVKKMNEVKRWRVEERESEAIEVNLHFVPKIVASLSGYLMRDVST